MNKTGRYLLIAALMVSIGAQWAVLQSAAWVGMAVSYSINEGSVTQGLSKTFDGRHPCPLCKAVAQGKQADKKAPTEKTAKLKLDLFCSLSVSFQAVVNSNVFPDANDEAALQRSTSPPVPPPRTTEVV